MPSKRRAFFRYRPRILTLIVFLVAAAVIVLANLSYDLAKPLERGMVNVSVPCRSYGWPLIWHRIVLDGQLMMGSQSAIGWYYSLPRLAVNLVVWLFLLAALAGTCEWLLRRYRPKPRWSLRTLLAFTALVAVLCGWYARARNRAAIQDPLISLRGGYGVPLVYVDRWGPKWLDVLGMERLRRRIVLASNWSLDSQQPAAEQQFLQLARAPELRHLTQFHVDELTPTLAKALGSMRQLQTLEISTERLAPNLPAALSELTQLRTLSITWGRWGVQPEAAGDNEVRLIDECLAAIGNMTRLETLHLSGLPLHGRGLACLAGLKELKSLEVSFWNKDWKGSRLDEPVVEDCLRAIVALTQLEWLRLENLRLRNEGLVCLANLANLKTLCLSRLNTDHPPTLSHLPALPRLEALGVDALEIQDADLRRLAALPRLKSLSLGPCLFSHFSHGHALLTPAGLAVLGSLDSLEQVQLGYDVKSPEEINALGTIRHLKRLHVSGSTFALYIAATQEPALKGASELHPDEFERIRQAFGALRQSKPGLIIDNDSIATLLKPTSDVGLSYYVDAFPERPTTWLPGGDLTWMTPQELAAFEQSAGRASFYGATYPGGPGEEPIIVEF